MKPADLAHIRTPSDPRLHPDGSRVAFVVTRIEIDEDRYHRRIWLWDGDQARPFTHGPSDGSPRWSPDGTRLAFLRKGEGDDAKAQVVVMPADGGEAMAVTEFPLGASELEWSPDGGHLAVIGASWIEGLADLDDDERKRRPRRIDRIPFRGDNAGYTHDRRSHLYLVDPDGSDEPRCLTPGDFDETTPVWRPDGSAITFASQRHDQREVEPGTQILEVDVDGGEAREVLGVGSWDRVSFAPDGAMYALGIEDQWDWPDNSRVYRVADDGGLTDLTGHLDRDVLPGSPAVTPAGPQWTGDRRFLIGLEDRGRGVVIDVDASEGEPEVTRVVDGERCVTGIAARPDGTAFAFLATDTETPGELYWYEDGQEHQLTDLSAELRDKVSITSTEHFTFERDGAEIDAWALFPAGDGPFPLLFNIHGGPTAQYGFYFFDEFQVYADAGYAVVGINPRGASGAGADWMRSILGTWGDPDSLDMLDLRAAVDAMLERYPDRIDADRLGIMGGSYGGFATARILARDQRFASAIVERGLLTWESFGGTSDIGAFFDQMFLQTRLVDDVEGMREASPNAIAHEIRTPTLVLHSENDFRCPIEQAEQFFAILRRSGVDSEFLRFPGESHELSRSGDPKHRVERFEAILDWHQRHLA